MIPKHSFALPLRVPRNASAAGRPASRRWLLAWVLFALVVAQALGFMHRVVHDPLGEVHAHVIAADEHAHEGHAHADSHAGHLYGTAWVADLFAAHEDASDCRIFDGVGQDSVPLPPAPGLPCVVPAAPMLPHLVLGFLAHWSAPYDARGPPVSR